MKRSKSILALLLVFLLLFTLSTSVLAAENKDPDRAVTLTITYRDQAVNLVGAEFDLYLLAEIDAYGEITVAEDFSTLNVNIPGKNDAAWKKLASTLEVYIPLHDIKPTDSGKTADTGTLLFPQNAASLKQGLYYVMGHRHTQGGMIYETEPFIVQLPTMDMTTEKWVYDVPAAAKFESSPEEEKKEPVTRKVLKKWNDRGYEQNRPEEIVVYLLQDGEIYETVKLSAQNNWRYTWTELDPAYRWTVAEEEVDGYTVEVTREGITFLVTNTSVKTPPSTPSSPGGSKLPQTGQLWWPVPVLLAAGLLAIVIGLFHRKAGRHEE